MKERRCQCLMVILLMIWYMILYRTQRKVRLAARSTQINYLLGDSMTIKWPIQVDSIRRGCQLNSAVVDFGKSSWYRIIEVALLLQILKPCITIGRHIWMRLKTV